MSTQRIIAVGLLNKSHLDRFGTCFTRLLSVDETPCFNDLLQAIDEADQECRRRGIGQTADERNTHCPNQLITDCQAYSPTTDSPRNNATLPDASAS